MSNKDLTNDYLTEEGKIDVELLREEFEGILKDVKKVNKGVVSAGRRFRLKTIKLAKDFLTLRKASLK